MSIEKLETNPEEFKVNKKENTSRSRFAASKQKLLSRNGECVVVRPVSTGTTTWSYMRYNHDTQTQTQMSGPTLPYHGHGDVAMWGNKIYSIYEPMCNQRAIEYAADYTNNTYTFVREIELDLNCNNWGVPLAYTMKDANTIIIHQRQQNIQIYDISGTTGVLVSDIYLGIQPDINPGPSVHRGGIVYYPNTNRALVCYTGGALAPSPSGIALVDLSTGAIIDYISSHVFAGAYLYNGKTYTSKFSSQQGLREVVITGNNISLGSGWDNSSIAWSWSGSDSSCLATFTEWCYYIGDTGPGGGTIFSVPLGHPQNNGVNQTNFYYEVAKNDINVGGAIPSSIYNQSCGDPIKQVVTIDASWFGQNFSNVTNNQDITFDFGSGTANPSFDPQNLNIGDTVQAFDAQGNNMFPPNTIVTVTNKTFFPSAPNIVLVEFDTPLNVLPNGVQLLSTQIATIKFGITIVAAGISATGNEFGAHDKVIQTSIKFGTGQDNTDTIHSYPITPGIHPTLSSRQIAATECLNHSSTGTYLGQPFTAGDWFLPSYGEFEEIQNQMTIGNIPGVSFKPLNTQTNEHVYWTSSAFRDNEFPGFTMPDPDKWAWVYKNMPSGLAPNIAFRCHPLSVRPIRRFECEPIKPPVDEGITYDYRIDTFGLPCAGNINQIALNSFISPNITTSVTIDAYAFSMLNQSTNQSGLVIFSNSDFVIAVDSTTVSSLPAIGSQFGLVGNVQYNLLGPVVDVIDIATHPQLGGLLSTFQAQAGANIDTFIVFNPSSNFLGPNGFFIGQNYPTLSFIDTLSYNLLSPNPAYSPPVFGSIFEIGHSNVMIQGMSRQDVRLNDVVGLGFNDRIETRVGEIFNIKIYSQYEELIGDWDYKLTNARNGFGCCTTHCFKSLYLELSQTNYVNPSFSSDPNIVDLKVYHEGNLVAGHPEGWAYVAITCVTDNTFNSNFVRGNTLNLENWRGTTQNNRTKNTSFPISGMQWKWQKEVCGYHTGTDACCGPGCGRYHAEVNPPQFNLYCNQFNNAVPNHTILFNNKQECIDYQEFTNNVSAKLTSPSVEYGQEANQCFEDGLEEVEVGIYKDTTDNESKSSRRKFVDRNKVEETGPFGINGYYPLYDTIEAARFNSPTFFATRDGEDTYGYHIHEFEGVEYYMPNGLEMGVTQFHGDYDGQIIPETNMQEQQVEEVVEPVQELPSVVTITPIEPEQQEPESIPAPTPPPASLPTPLPTYTPPPSTSSGSSGGGGGGGY